MLAGAPSVGGRPVKALYVGSSPTLPANCLVLLCKRYWGQRWVALDALQVTEFGSIPNDSTKQRPCSLIGESATLSRWKMPDRSRSWSPIINRYAKWTKRPGLQPGVEMTLRVRVPSGSPMPFSSVVEHTTDNREVISSNLIGATN